MASSGEVASIPGSLSLVNLKIVNRMAENFLVYLEEHVIWFVECCSDLELSKTLFFFVLLQSFCIKRKDVCHKLAEWETSVAADVVLDEILDFHLENHSFNFKLRGFCVQRLAAQATNEIKFHLSCFNFFMHSTANWKCIQECAKED
ncbi:U3 small nucleolar RNA-associated protein 10 [Vigna unguiculata]|uniref:U3 small nucleolar RNA-associated protein 10 n=1 Tax=Vigna unguiculata TaxID=3917 RepID=A0A4D6NR90_VIGUN|nr:U3 small nucleolar RNA-associated protein 10 [Vigna unguiculata]